MSRLVVLAFVCLILLGLVLAWGQWRVKGDLQETHQFALEQALSEAGLEELEVEVEDFAVSLRGEVNSSWEAWKAEELVNAQRPLYLAEQEQGQQGGLWMKARLQPMFQFGKVRFSESQLREEQLQQLRSWSLRLRPGLEGGIRWEEIATDERVVGELGLPESDELEPVEGSLAAKLYPFLQEPALFWAFRDESDAFTVLAQWPQEDWSTTFEQAMEAVPDLSRPRWAWQKTQRGMRWGMHIKRRAFAQPEAAEICAFLAQLLADIRIQAVMWKGGNGGGFEILARQRMEGEEVSALRREAARLSGLTPKGALLIGGVGEAAQ